MSIQSVRTTKSRLPRTGQVISYSDYDDGYYHLQKGSPILPDKIDNGDNTIIDRVTGLQIIKQPELIIPDGLNVNNIGVPRGFWVSGTTYNAGDIVTDSADNSAWFCLTTNSDTNTDFVTERGATTGIWSLTASPWAIDDGNGNLIPRGLAWNAANSGGAPDALSSCEGLTKSGKSDWRLPTINELASIIDWGLGGDGSNPAIDPIFFPNTQLTPYWSSTVFAVYPSYIWYVDFYYGVIYVSYLVYNYYVRPVRQYL